MSQLFAPLQELIQGGNDIQANKYFSASTVTLVFYDYALTFEDEVRYIWGGRKTWVFYLFILNRYLPMVYKIWTVIEDYWPDYTVESCSRSAILQPIFFVWSTMLAQIFLKLRIYVLSGQNKIILGVFVSITIIQAITGILLTAIPSSSIVKPPPIPLDAFHICIFDAKISYEIAYTSISLLYDIVAFVLIVCLSLHGVGKISTIIRTIVEDATIYFLVIFTSHIILTFFIIFARENLKLTPAIGNNILIPLMVTRLLLSLRKAGHPETIAQWNADHFTGLSTFTSMIIARDHFAPSDTQQTTTRHISKTEPVVGSVLELTDIGRQNKRHSGTSDGGI